MSSDLQWVRTWLACNYNVPLLERNFVFMLIFCIQIWHRQLTNSMRRHVWRVKRKLKATVTVHDSSYRQKPEHIWSRWKKYPKKQNYASTRQSETITIRRSRENKAFGAHGARETRCRGRESYAIAANQSQEHASPCPLALLISGLF